MKGNLICYKQFYSFSWKYTKGEKNRIFYNFTKLLTFLAENFIEMYRKKWCREGNNSCNSAKI